MKIWNKDNILVERFSGSFDPQKLDGLSLIKIPNYNSKYFFSVLNSHYDRIPLITSESIDGEHEMYGYYEMTMDDTNFDKDTIIELYDVDSKTKIKTITLKDLYLYWSVLSNEFVFEARDKLAMITTHPDDQTVIKYIGKISIRRNSGVLFSIEHFLGHRDMIYRKYDKFVDITAKRIRDMDITIQILNDKDSLIHAINEIGDDNIE